MHLLVIEDERALCETIVVFFAWLIFHHPFRFSVAIIAQES